MKSRIWKERNDGISQHYWIGQLADSISKDLSKFGKVTIAGSIRRKKEPNDIDLVMISDRKDEVKDYFRRKGRIVAEGDTKVEAFIKKVKTDVFFSDKKSFPAQLLRRTGPAGANIKNSEIARSKGLLLNEYGLFNRKTKKRIPNIKSEKDIYKKLGKPYRLPEQRGLPRSDIHDEDTHV